MTKKIGLLLTLGIVMEVLYCFLRSLIDLRAKLPEAIAATALAHLFYIVSVWLILNFHTSSKPFRIIWLPALVVTVAVIFRLTVWPLFPAFSDDPYRYRWEGQLQALGGNPYQATPDDPNWATLHDAAFPSVVTKDVPAVYGPLIQLIERATYKLVSSWTSDPFRQVFWFKLPYAAMDLGALAVLALLLRSRGRPVEYVLIYAWCPTPIIEFWATGHNDSALLVLLLLALLMAAKERWVSAFVFLGLAGACKFWPLLLIPAFIGWERGRPARAWQWVAAIPAFLLPAIPYWSNVSTNVRFLTGFLGGWRNNDSLYGLLLAAAGDPLGAKYAVAVLIAATALAVALARIPLERACLWLIGIMLLVSANCHPWYLTWFTPFLAFSPVPVLPAFLLWGALMPLSYSVLFRWIILGEWDGSTPMRWLIYVPVFLVLLGEWITKRVGLSRS